MPLVDLYLVPKRFELRGRLFYGWFRSQNVIKSQHVGNVNDRNRRQRRIVMGMKPKVGDAAPDFEGQRETSNDTQVRLKDYLGKKNIVLYFYPKDDTEGCTMEACTFRDKLQPIGALWTEVIGVSVDTAESHKKFAQKYGLNFPLVSDHDKQISKAYGVLSEDGSKAKRVTFIIDKEGKIARIFTNVDVTRHGNEIIDALKQLAFKKPKT